MQNKWRPGSGVNYMVNNILIGLMAVFNFVLVVLVILCFFYPSLIIYTFVFILCSYALNEMLVERRLSRVEEILKKFENSM